MKRKRFTLLEVDLTGKTSRAVDVTDDVERFVGGRSLGAKILWDRTEPFIDPLSEANVLYFGIGPITGLLGSVTNVSAKSPLTMLKGHANLNGHFGVELIYAGYNAGIVLTGKSDRPVYLYVKDDQVEIRDARHLAGKSGLETQCLLASELRQETDDQNFRFVAIGKAGENLVRNADMCHDLYHHAARLGMGTVMGSKGLKAIAVKGSRSPGYVHPDRVFDMMKVLLREGRAYRARNRRWGHSTSLASRYYKTREGVKNKQLGWDALCDQFNPVTLEQQYKVWGDSCHGCFVACKVPYLIRDLPMSPFAGEMRHDNAGGWSANTMIPGFDVQGYLSSYVDYLGLDSEDVSGVVAWMMECYERGLVTREDLGGIDLTWGNLEAICALLDKIASRQGIGTVLADGLRSASGKLGRDMAPYAMTHKGVAITSYEVRGSMQDALDLAVTPVGELHGGRGNPLRVLYDSLTTCTFWRNTLGTLFEGPAGWGITAMNAACGWDLATEDWDRLALRAATMERCYSLREGYVPERDDMLPHRFFEETIHNKYGAAKSLDKETFLRRRKETYRSYGLEENGIPSARFLEELGLEFTIPRLEETLKADI